MMTELTSADESIRRNMSRAITKTTEAKTSARKRGVPSASSGYSLIFFEYRKRTV